MCKAPYIIAANYHVTQINTYTYCKSCTCWVHEVMLLKESKEVIQLTADV